METVLTIVMTVVTSTSHISHQHMIVVWLRKVIQMHLLMMVNKVLTIMMTIVLMIVMTVVTST
eukprot:1188950-Ditylum_brightwellii.AAC.1